MDAEPAIQMESDLDSRSDCSDDRDEYVHHDEDDVNQRLLVSDHDADLEPPCIMETTEAKSLRSKWPRWWPVTCRPSRLLSWVIAFFAICILLLVVITVHFVVYRKSKMNFDVSPPWYPTPLGGMAAEWAQSYAKASALVSRMHLTEKVNITTGIGWSMGMCVGNTGPVPRLDFPSLCLQDGPLGIRYTTNMTAFPAGITAGATWNRDLIKQRGQALGLEFRLKGINVMLGPAMGPLGRSPLGGRNWEGFGADPVLAGVAAAETIKGIQSEGVIATAKHWVGNEQELYRQAGESGTWAAISSNIDDRTLHEVYGWPFQDSVRAGVGSVMCAYNQVNNSYACQNSKLLNGILKDEYGFQGFVQSDWLAQRSGVASALSGMDMSMPGDGLTWQDGTPLWGPHLTTAVLNGSIPIVRLNDMVTRIVATWYQFGQDDRTTWKEGPNFSSWTTKKIGLLHTGSDDDAEGVVNRFVDVQGHGEKAHSLIARKVAVEGTVLVKNNGSFLPINDHGFSVAAGTLKGSTKRKVAIIGSDAFPDPNGPNSCKERACNSWTIASGWGSGAVDFPYLVSPADALDTLFNNATSVEISKFAWNDLSSPNVKEIQDQDLCFVFLMSISGEGFIHVGDIKGDRNDLIIQNGGDELVRTVTEQCGHGNGDVVVVIHSTGPVMVEDFIDKPNVRAVIFANLPGQESGNALVDIISGKENPSGRLPYTVGKSLADYGSLGKSVSNVEWTKGVPQSNFDEGLLIDYRHFDQENIPPRFEFGFGLSYTNFVLSDLQVKVLTDKSPTPAPRPAPAVRPPWYGIHIPGVSNSLFPPGFRRLKKYIYPYIDSDDDIVYDPAPPLPVHAVSPAGGAQGGNPSLWEPHVNITVNVMNTGHVAGATVVQLYLAMPRNYRDADTKERISFPQRMLRQFDKVYLKAGEIREVTLTLNRRDVSYWSVTRQNWVIPTKRRIVLEVGFSSRDLPLKGGF